MKTWLNNGHCLMEYDIIRELQVEFSSSPSFLFVENTHANIVWCRKLLCYTFIKTLIMWKSLMTLLCNDLEKTHTFFIFFSFFVCKLNYRKEITIKKMIFTFFSFTIKKGVLTMIPLNFIYAKIWRMQWLAN